MNTQVRNDKINGLIYDFAVNMTELVYKDGRKFEDDPLDGDETEAIGKLFVWYLDMQNGNLSKEDLKNVPLTNNI